MTILPPPIMTSEKGSFARKTIEELKPGIIDNILSEYDYTPQIKKSLIELKNEMINGQIKPLREQTSDKPIWDADTSSIIDLRWVEIPWLLAETFFFRRILEAVQYFQPGPWQGRDPFQHLKNKEISSALESFSEAYEPESRKNLRTFQNAAYQALWGNQSDLSNLEIYESTTIPQIENLILDQSNAAYEYAAAHETMNIAYFFDNVGKELYFDLAFIDYLLQSEIAQSITCYLKNQPFFVSDAQPKDLQKAIDYLASSSVSTCKSLAERITTWMKSGKIKITTPPFLTTSRSYRNMSESLKMQISKHDFTILKGDVNFRKLVGDRHWDPTTPIKVAAGYFYTPLMSLRAIKAELILGFKKDQFNKLEEQSEKDWLINGKKGMILFVDN